MKMSNPTRNLVCCCSKPCLITVSMSSYVLMNSWIQQLKKHPLEGCTLTRTPGDTSQPGREAFPVSRERHDERPGGVNLRPLCHAFPFMAPTARSMLITPHVSPNKRREKKTKMKNNKRLINGEMTHQRASSCPLEHTHSVAELPCHLRCAFCLVESLSIWGEIKAGGSIECTDGSLGTIHTAYFDLKTYLHTFYPSFYLVSQAIQSFSVK